MSNVDAVSRPPSPLASRIEVQTRDLDWTLAHFTFVANVTTLATECDIAHSPSMSVASCHTLATPVLAFVGDSPDLLANYAIFLVTPGTEVYLLVSEAQRAIVEAAFTVLQVQPEWQMVWRGTLEALPPTHALELHPEDLSAMQTLAKSEKVVLQALAKDPFQQGSAFGVWDKKKLVAMGTTNVRLPGAAQIGNLITRKDYRRRGYASAIVSDLVRTLQQQDLLPFSMVMQDNTEAVHLFEELGFVRERPMYLLHCVLKAEETDAIKDE